MCLLIAFFWLGTFAAAAPITETFSFNDGGWLIGFSDGQFRFARIGFDFVSTGNLARLFDLYAPWPPVATATPTLDASGFVPSLDMVNSGILQLQFDASPTSVIVVTGLGDGARLLDPMPIIGNTLSFDLTAPENAFAIAALQDGVFVDTALSVAVDLHMLSATLTIDDGQLPSAVPEPGSLLLLSTGLLGIGFVARRRLQD
jgi:hypothetical protein